MEARWTPAWHPLFVSAVALAGVCAVGVLDELTGPDVSSTLLYLAPIGFATWFAGRWTGLVTVAASAEVWLVADLLARDYGQPTSRYWNVLLELGVFAIFCVVLGELKKRLRREEALARRDALTGLPNRRHFSEIADHEVARSRRHVLPLTAVSIDIDDFKIVNDTLGHEAGDALLAAVANALRRSIRDVDVAARLGGDEFALLLPDTAALAATALLERVRTQLLLCARQGDWPVTFSIGAATFEVAPQAAADLLRLADGAMYQIKASGKGALRHLVRDAHSGDPLAPAIGWVNGRRRTAPSNARRARGDV